MKEIKIYTDGACSGNPGPGGYGVVLLFNGHRKELSGGYNNTTNNRMEIMGVIKGLDALKEKCQVSIYSDSRYVVDAIEKGWLEKWRSNNWFRTRNEKAKNADLWELLYNRIQLHQVKFFWIKGHNDNPENTICDKLAVAASKESNLPEDFRGE